MVQIIVCEYAQIVDNNCKVHIISIFFLHFELVLHTLLRNYSCDHGAQLRT